VSVGLFDARDRVDLGHDEIRQRTIIRRIDQTKDIRLTKTGMSTSWAFPALTFINMYAFAAITTSLFQINAPYPS
jgi:hypothetical protein